MIEKKGEILQRRANTMGNHRIIKDVIKRMKLNSQDGESIGEVLVALLISSLALVMLASMITATTRIVTRSKKWTNNYVSASNVLIDQGSSNPGTGAVSLKVKVDGVDTVIKLVDDANKSIPVYYYTNSTISSTPVTVYRKTPSTS